jgi:hypothetical protein
MRIFALKLIQSTQNFILSNVYIFKKVLQSSDSTKSCFKLKNRIWSGVKVLTFGAKSEKKICRRRYTLASRTEKELKYENRTRSTQLSYRQF